MRRKLRKPLAILLAFAMVFCVAPNIGFAADNDANSVERVSGHDRYETAANIAEYAFPNGADAVVIANGEPALGYADALAGSFLAGAAEAPILLTQANVLPDATAEAIETLNATRAYVLGGELAVSDAVYSELEALGLEVERVWGQNRYATAVKVYETGAELVGTVNTALIANATRPSDALAAGAYANEANVPVLLVDQDSIHPATEAALAGIENTFVIGGNLVVSDEVVSELDATRVSGRTRNATSVAVAETLWESPENFVLVNGADGIVDALAGSVLGMPILYVPSDDVDAYLDKVITANSRGLILGGVNRISDEFLNEIQQKIEGVEEELQVVSVSAIENITVEFGGELVLPETVKATLDNEEATEVTLAIEWAENEEFNAEVAGDYEFTGTLSKVEGEEVEFTIPEDKATVTVKVTVEEEVVEALRVESVSAINAKTLKVEFNNAIAEQDQAKVTFDVKRGTIATTVETTWAEDGKSVELARATNLLAGTYTVTVGGLEFAEGANVGTVEVEAQEIASLEIATDNVIIGNPVDLVYNAKDQYGEKMDVTADKIAWTVVNTTDITRAVTAGTGTPATDKVIKLDTSATNVDDVLRVTAFLTADPTIKVVKEVTVSNVFTQEFALGTVVLPEGKTRLDQAVSAYDVELSYTAADNYGEAVKLPASQTGATIGEITFVSSNEDLVKVANMATDAKSKLTFKVEAAKSGKATLTALNNSTGETSSVEIEVFATAAPATAEFGEFKDGAEIVAGDAAGTAKLGITFFDQYGEAIEDDTYTIGTDFNVTVTGAGTLTVTPALVGGYMVFDDSNATAGTYTITLVHKTTGASASTQVTVNEARVPNELKVKTAPDASVEVAGTTDVTFEVYDQYGKLIPFGNLTPYTIDVTYSNAGTTASVVNTTLTSYTETITGNAAGTETITFTLNSGAPITAIDAQEFEIEVIDALASLDVTVDKTEYTAGDTATVTIKAESAVGTVHTDYNKTEVAEIAVGSNKYLRTVTFVNGVATTTVPVEEAGATVTINATVNAKTDGTAPTVKVIAAEANKLIVIDNAGAKELFVSDAYGNVADYDFTGIVTVTGDVAGFSGTLNAEKQMQIKIVDGVVTDTSDVALTFTGSADDTLTIELSNGDTFSITL